jgi:hypothetical protein
MKDYLGVVLADGKFGHRNEHLNAKQPSRPASTRGYQDGHNSISFASPPIAHLMMPAKRVRQPG